MAFTPGPGWILLTLEGTLRGSHSPEDWGQHCANLMRFQGLWRAGMSVTQGRASKLPEGAKSQLSCWLFPWGSEFLGVAVSSHLTLKSSCQESLHQRQDLGFWTLPAENEVEVPWKGWDPSLPQGKS